MYFLNPKKLFKTTIKMLRLTIREEAEDSVAALSTKVEVLMRRKEKLEAALAQVGPAHVAIVSCSAFLLSLFFWFCCYSSAITKTND